ncbi:hypothetical protein SeMB42_g05678 [Synchytrium endobioticum]|uniref:Protein HGH1 homolog n=1 Tax=Synchytrium endobioticum TaxID=286115 RepID=A0A507CPY7_9FUNG|nr:hypothetical protein SeMB42_g05678 [Synchytrium endobioticum]TPX41863.1 hypothetical protein SeLEV6574_g05886 [Synchytrium endobioticum]
MTGEDPVEELFGFLNDDRVDVRQEAVKIVASLTGYTDNFALFKEHKSVIKDLMSLVADDPLIAHDALSALINLSADAVALRILTSAENGLLYRLLLMTLQPSSILADLCCMLLNNLSKSALVVKMLLPPPCNQSNSNNHATAPSETLLKSTAMLDNLLEVFVKGVDRKYNPHAEYHMLAGVFANISGSPLGASIFLENSVVNDTPRLSSLIPFTEHSNLVRRGGVISCLKNVCFAVVSDKKLVDDRLRILEDVNFLGTVLLPLAGPDEYDDEEMEGMPPELQLLEDAKKREPDAKLRLVLVESLLWLCAHRAGREWLRKNKAYPVLKRLHLWEKDSAVQEGIEKTVDLLMREESALEELADANEENGKKGDTAS